MAIIGCVWLQTVALAALISVVSARLIDSSVTASCHQQSFLHPLSGNISCSRVCPPALSSDVNLRFCSLNCDAYYECLRSRLPVVSSVETSNSTCPSTWFYHPRYGLVDCRLVCTTPNITQYCSINCPMYYRCLTQS